MTSDTPLHLVTGATGWLGPYLVQRLLDDGRRVRVLDRNPTKLPRSLQDERIEVRVGDILEPESLRPATQGVAVVHHCAYLLSGKAGYRPDLARLINGEGMRNVLAAAAGAGVQQLHFLNSLVAYGEPESIPVTEDHPIS